MHSSDGGWAGPLTGARSGYCDMSESTCAGDLHRDLRKVASLLERPLCARYRGRVHLNARQSLLERVQVVLGAARDVSLMSAQ
jgi:hypothetical protein